ncbi:MAG: bifunctional tetrahydrofolate synthase/dihydrofolate synthase [Steroidobacteraceae bacterium]
MPGWSLDRWLEWQQGLHPQGIELGLERVRRVAERLGILPPAPLVFTVGGTNGKGSVVAMLDAMLRAAGYRVGRFTSPHLRRYNERIVLDGQEVDDAALVAAFERIEATRQQALLTFFEWNALAALLLMRDGGVEVAVLEVGLGGRLDAVNIVDPDVAAVVSIGLDHCEWLGSSVEAIGREKAGIFREGRPAVFGSRDMPRSILACATQVGARLARLGVDYDYVEGPEDWTFVGPGCRREGLPVPALAGPVQLANAACALAALAAAEPRVLVSDDAVRAGLLAVELPGRFQVIHRKGCQWILDVAHNPAAARVLADNLAGSPVRGRTFAVMGLLQDKDAGGVLEALRKVVDVWILCGLPGERGRSAAALSAIASDLGLEHVEVAHLHEGLTTAGTLAIEGDRVVVAGSFHVVGPALAWLE